MGDKKRIDLLETKVAALEYLLKHAWWQIVIARTDADGGDDQDAINELRNLAADMAHDLDHTPMPAVDAVSSDHLSAGARDHVERFFQALVSEMIANEDGP